MTSAFTRIAAIALATATLSACLPTEPEIRRANAAGGDYNLLDCEGLAVAAGSVKQRIAVLSPETAIAFSIVTPQGLRVEERKAFLDEALVDIGAVRERRGCRTVAPILTAPQLREQPLTDQTTFMSAGRYLQAATFEAAVNRDTALDAFAAKGVPTEVRDVTINGLRHWRVLLGPLRTPEQADAADAAARDLGLTDAFFVKG